jgi:hypothetical protein
VERRLAHPGVVLRCIVQDDDHAFAVPPRPQRLAYEGFERLAVEDWAERGYQAAGAQVDFTDDAHPSFWWVGLVPEKPIWPRLSA